MPREGLRDRQESRQRERKNPRRCQKERNRLEKNKKFNKSVAKDPHGTKWEEGQKNVSKGKVKKGKDQNDGKRKELDSPMNEAETGNICPREEQKKKKEGIIERFTQKNTIREKTTHKRNRKKPIL